MIPKNAERIKDNIESCDCEECRVENKVIKEAEVNTLKWVKEQMDLLEKDMRYISRWEELKDRLEEGLK